MFCIKSYNVYLLNVEYRIEFYLLYYSTIIARIFNFLNYFKNVVKKYIDISIISSIITFSFL